MEPFVEIKSVTDDFEVECEIIPAIDKEALKDTRLKNISSGIQEADMHLEEIENKLAKLNSEIDRLTCHADGVDYTIAVASGVLAGLIDAFFVGELGVFENASDEAKSMFSNAKGSTHEVVNRFIEKYAKMLGYNGKRGLKGAIIFLEDKFPVGQDNIWSGLKISSTKTHHLEDLAHHPTVLGLFSAILVQFLRVSIFANKNGEISINFVPPEKEDIIKIAVPIILSGLIKWLIYLAEENEIIDFDEKIPKPIQVLIKELHTVPIVISILKTADNWFGHLVSDMGGSRNTPGGGTGIPGIFLSLLKEFSMLPGVKDSSLPKIVNDLYQNTKNSPLTNKLDLRTELTVVKKQILPVVINEVLVRGLFFIKHLITEVKKTDKIEDIEWHKVVPLGNRTIVRMMTIASITFTIVDLADAAIETATKHPEACTNLGAFAGTMILRVNFVGLGRFAMAIVTDTGMGIKRSYLRNERIKMCTEQIAWSNVKVFYKQADMWISAESTEETINEAYEAAEKSALFYLESMKEIADNLRIIEDCIPAVEEKNPGLIEKLDDIITWG